MVVDANSFKACLQKHSVHMGANDKLFYRESLSGGYSEVY